jgi:acyl-coenzyme A thioesterase 9
MRAAFQRVAHHHGARRFVRATRLLSVVTRVTNETSAQTMTQLLSLNSKRIASQVSAGTFLDSSLPQPHDLSSITKTVRDSYLRLRLPLGSDVTLRNSFINSSGFIRVGKLLEELDLFAGAVALLHCDDGDATHGMPALVTAAFDRVQLLTHPLISDVDLIFSGAVTYVGRSSLNVEVELATSDGQLVFTASTTFVARNGVAGGSIAVPQLAPRTDVEQSLYEAGRAASEARRRVASSSLLRSPPSAEELSILHKLFLDSSETAGAGWARLSARNSPGAVHFSDETRLTTTLVTMPQDQNIYGRIFGGWLMRVAYEAAWACGWRATQAPPRFLALDSVVFSAPVEVGTLLQLDAQIAFSDPLSNAFTVTVDAAMSTPGRRSDQHTNQFSFVFERGPTPGAQLPRFIPRTYAEGLALLEARRRHTGLVRESKPKRSAFPASWD